MGTRTAVVLEDDLDGGPADQTLEFGLGGTEYVIDLSAKNAAKFRRQLAPFIEHARKVDAGSAAGPPVPSRLVSAAAISGRGRKTRASRSATAAASQRASPSSTTPLTSNGTDRGRRSWPVRDRRGGGSWPNPSVTRQPWDKNVHARSQARGRHTIRRQPPAAQLAAPAVASHSANHRRPAQGHMQQSWTTVIPARWHIQTPPSGSEPRAKRPPAAETRPAVGRRRGAVELVEAEHVLDSNAGDIYASPQDQNHDVTSLRHHAHRQDDIPRRRHRILKIVGRFP